MLHYYLDLREFFIKNGCMNVENGQTGTESNPPPKAYPVHCTYLVKKEKIEALREVLLRHWPTLRRHGLVTEEPARVYFGTCAAGPFFVEILTWVDEGAPARAYWKDEINEMWSLLFAYTEERNGRPGIEYPAVEMFDLSTELSE